MVYYEKIYKYDIIKMVINMKRLKDKIIINQKQVMKKSLLKRYDISEEFLDMVFDEIEKKYSEKICNNYNLENIFDNPFLAYKIYLSICLNHEFDLDRFKEIDFSDEYNDNFISRVVAQTLYSDLNNTTFPMSHIVNHPVILILLSLSSLIKYRAIYHEPQVLKRRKHTDYLPILKLVSEAMTSLESILVLISERAFSQAKTIYRLYLEQIIISMAIIKNPNLINKYLEHQRLIERYANNTSDSEILKIIEEKKIPARDVKSYLSYGWIEGIDGFNELPKQRYSIKIMAKLCDVSNIYELYADATNYVHMNYLYSGVDWLKEVNKTIETLYATIIGVMNNYSVFSGYNFVYKNIDLKNELFNIFREYESLIDKEGYDIDILRLKSA